MRIQLTPNEEPVEFRPGDIVWVNGRKFEINSAQENPESAQLKLKRQEIER